MLPIFLSAFATSLGPSLGGCTTNLDCSLNGACVSAACTCDKPWGGPRCGVLQYKVTPAGALNIYNTSDPRNTWNGPIVKAEGKYHIYDPIYKVGSLGGPTAILHGTADVITGPWEWTSRPVMQGPHGNENPASVTFEDSNGKLTYSLWVGGVVQLADSPDGPWVEIADFTYPGGNPAPVFNGSAWYFTNQQTDAVFTAPKLASGVKWTSFATIPHDNTPIPDVEFHVEDPFMYIDTNAKSSNLGAWHIINHAYANKQFDHCGTSIASSHYFSLDGKTWHSLPLPYVMPYHHTVNYDDGTSHTFTTLERPNMHFDSSGLLTHINLAVDLVVGDEGCGSRTKHAHDGHTPCDNCKWDDHAGTTVIALDV